MATILMISPKSTDQTASPGGRAKTLGGGTPDTGCRLNLTIDDF